MASTPDHSISVLIIRNFLVVASAIGMAFSIYCFISNSFKELSILIGIALASGSVIMFGWSCYLGHNRKEITKATA